MVNYHTNNLDVDEMLQALCEKKLQTLEKFFSHYEEASFDVEFHQEGASNAGKQYRIGITLNLDGDKFHASAIEESFEQAIDEVRDELDKELRRHHDKQMSLMRRGGRAIKNLLRFGQ